MPKMIETLRAIDNLDSVYVIAHPSLKPEFEKAFNEIKEAPTPPILTEVEVVFSGFMPVGMWKLFPKPPGPFDGCSQWREFILR